MKLGWKWNEMRVKSVANIWKIRNRQCNGAKIGSDSCPKGENVETQPCGGFPCARWASWNNWSPCSRTCGVSESVRVRTCIFGSIGDDGCPEEDSKDNRECKQETCGKFILKTNGPQDRKFRNRKVLKPEVLKTGIFETGKFWDRKFGPEPLKINETDVSVWNMTVHFKSCGFRLVYDHPLWIWPLLNCKNSDFS